MRLQGVAVFAGLMLALGHRPVHAQQPGGAGVQLTPDFVSPPIPAVLTAPAGQALRAADAPGPPRPVNPRRTYPRPGAVPVPPAPPEIDALLAVQDAAAGNPPTYALTASLNFAGQGYSNVSPSDVVGAVGPAHYVQMINGSSGTRVTIYDKATGSVTTGPFLLETLGSGGSCAEGNGDPIALYDRLASRWLLSEFASTGSHLCVYVSQTSDPAGAYFRYDFPTPQFPDYPKYSVWSNAYYVTTNESSPRIYALDRTQMLSGAAATSQGFTVPDLAGFPFQALTPADFDGPTAPPVGSPGYFTRHRDDEVHNAGANDPSRDFVEVWQLQPDFAAPANSVLSGPTSIGVTSFDSSLCGLTSFACFAQPGTTTTLDPLREVVMWRLQYRNFGAHASMVGNFVVDVNGADRGGVRWFELRKAGAAAWTLHQEGTYSPDATNRWMGSLAMDGSGNIALGYSVSSSAVNAGLRYTGRQAGDAPGTMTTPEATIVDGTGAQTSNTRWGDYHAMSLDPADDCTFWFTGQYLPAANWGTRVVNLKFDSCGTPLPSLSINDVAVTEGQSGTKNATFTVSLSAASASTVSVHYATDDVTAWSASRSNPTAIPIPDLGVSSVYPSSVTVPAGIGTVTKVTAVLSGFSHTFPGDVDVLLAGPAGQSVVLMSDVGGGNDASALTFTFDDDAGVAMPVASALASGTYVPTNPDAGDDFPAPAPAPPHGTTLSVFTGTDPAGLWRLFVVDDVGGDSGIVSGGWALTIMTTTGADYVPKAGTASIAASATSQTVSITINGDTAVEPDETFVVNLSSASGATLGDAQGVGTIVNDESSFTDDPLIAQVHVVRAVHITELRTRIDAARVARGLLPYAWGATLVAGASAVAAQHVMDLRTALTQVYVAAGVPVPTFTDPGTLTGVPIRAVHISELRAAVLTIE